MSNAVPLLATILTLDPSTEVTGAAVLMLFEDGKILVTKKAAFDGFDKKAAFDGFDKKAAFDGFELCQMPRSRKDLRSRVDRITETRGSRVDRITETRAALAAFVRTCGVVPTHVAYETQSGRGHDATEALVMHDATEALVMAVGAYLSLSYFKGLPLIEVNRAAACKAAGAYGVYSEKAGTTTKEKDAKRARLKQAVIQGVNARLGLSLRPDQDAIADAIAVGLVACERIMATKRRKTSKTTPPPTGGGRKSTSHGN